MTLHVKNTGTVPLAVQVLSDQEWAMPAVDVLSLAPAQEVRVPVFIEQDQAEGQAVVAFTFATDAADGPAVRGGVASVLSTSTPPVPPAGLPLWPFLLAGALLASVIGERVLRRNRARRPTSYGW